MYTTISADVISYTLLPEPDKRLLEKNLQQLLGDLSIKFSNYNFYGRLVQGDYIECAMNSTEYALRIALLLKTFVKSIGITTSTNKKSLKYFLEHGLRIAVAIAPLKKLDPENGIIDGEAIYLSGRAIKNLSTSDKKRVVIKNTMFFKSSDEKLQDQMNAFFSLLDIIISKCSTKQSEVVYYKLQNLSEKEIAKKLNKSQSTISQHSTSAGWTAIENVVNYYEKILSSCF